MFNLLATAMAILAPHTGKDMVKGAAKVSKQLRQKRSHENVVYAKTRKITYLGEAIDEARRHMFIACNASDGVPTDKTSSTATNEERGVEDEIVDALLSPRRKVHVRGDGENYVASSPSKHLPQSRYKPKTKKSSVYSPMPQKPQLAARDDSKHALPSFSKWQTDLKHNEEEDAATAVVKELGVLGKVLEKKKSATHAQQSRRYAPADDRMQSARRGALRKPQHKKGTPLDDILKR